MPRHTFCIVQHLPGHDQAVSRWALVEFDKVTFLRLDSFQGCEQFGPLGFGNSDQTEVGTHVISPI
jgi:hypothetical protein